MKLLRDGKIYDTEKSEKVYECRSTFPLLLLNQLYRTSRGSYFLISQGAVAFGGCEMQVLSEDKAIGWLENEGAAEVLLTNFGDRYEEA